MDERLETEELKLFRESLRRFVAREITPFVGEWEKAGEVPRELWFKLGREGFLCPWLPEEYGGLGLGFEYSVVILEELIRGDGFGVGVPLHSDVVAPYLLEYGSAETKDRWLPGCTTGEVVTAIGMSEPGTGSDLAAIRTKAVRDGGGYVLNGQKTFITNGWVADLFVIAARTGEGAGRGISLFVVAKDTPGFAKGRKLEKMGCHMQDTAELFFEDCRIPAENLLGEEGTGFRYLMSQLQQERLAVAVMGQVLAEECLKEALDYARTREAFGRRIGDHQHLSFKLAEMATEVEIGRTFIDRLVWEHVQKRDIVTKVSMAKYWLAEMANRISYAAVQVHGGYGYMEEYRICRLFRDARCLPIFAGTTEIMKLIVSRNLGFSP